jgi:hypothetical protein
MLAEMFKVSTDPRFAEKLEAIVGLHLNPPDHKPLHLIVDNYAAHKHPAVQCWLKRHPRSIFTSHPPVLRGSTW